MPRNIRQQMAFLLATLLGASTGFGDEQACEPITVREPDLDNWIDGSKEPSIQLSRSVTRLSATDPTSTPYRFLYSKFSLAASFTTSSSL